MKNIIIVSKCLGVTQQNRFENTYKFHFVGVYAGESVKRVVLIGEKKSLIKKNVEYLIYVKILACSNGILEGTILKYKALDDCWDKS